MDQSGRSRPRPVASFNFVRPTEGKTSRVIVGGLLATGVMVACLAATQLVNFAVYNLRFESLDSDYHSSVFGVASLLAQAAAALAIVWRGTGVARQRRAWLVLGGLVAGLVFVRGLTTFNATLLAAPLGFVLVLLCWVTWREPRATRSAVWAGLILMVTSLALHKVGLAADSSTASDYTWPYQLLTVVKHGCELAGWMLLATGITAGILDRPAAPVIHTEISARGDGIPRVANGPV